MSRSGIFKADQQFSSKAKKDNSLLNQLEQERQARMARTANLRAQRIAKEAADMDVAKKAAAEKARAPIRKRSGSAKARRPQS